MLPAFALVNGLVSEIVKCDGMCYRVRAGEWSGEMEEVSGGRMLPAFALVNGCNKEISLKSESVTCVRAGEWAVNKRRNASNECYPRACG